MEACIIATGAAVKGGYIKRMVNGCASLAHRHAYAAAHGLEVCKDLRGVVIMHSCDNPACVNPAHLSAGTQQDNITDMMRKGRNVPGPGRGHKGPRTR